MRIGRLIADWRRERAGMAAFFDLNADAIVLADRDRRIVRVNDSFQRLFQYEPSAVIGEPTAILYADYEAFEDAGEARYNVSSIEAPLRYRLDYKRADGSVFCGLTTGMPVRSKGETLGFVGSISLVEQD